MSFNYDSLPNRIWPVEDQEKTKRLEAMLWAKEREIDALKALQIPTDFLHHSTMTQTPLPGPLTPEIIKRMMEGIEANQPIIPQEVPYTTPFGIDLAKRIDAAMQSKVEIHWQELQRKDPNAKRYSCWIEDCWYTVQRNTEQQTMIINHMGWYDTEILESYLETGDRGEFIGHDGRLSTLLMQVQDWMTEHHMYEWMFDL